MSITTNPKPYDTGEIRRVVGEDTRVIQPYDLASKTPAIRLDDAVPAPATGRAAFGLAGGSTGELPILGVPASQGGSFTPKQRGGRHRAPNQPGLLVRALAAVGINLAGGAQ